MTRPRASLTAIGAAAAIVLAACGTADTNGGGTSARLYHRQLFAYPADPAKKATAAPDLAEQLPTTANGGISADGKTYTITIKQGVQWNTNPPRQVTAADAVAITQQDQPVIIGIVLLGTAAVVVANILVDIGYAVLDPRVRLT